MSRRRFWVTDKDYIWRRMLAHQRAKENKALRDAKHIANNTLPRKRHYDYVDAFFPKLLRIMNTKMNEKETNHAIKEASMIALTESGFKLPILNKDGSLNKRTRKKAASILKLPPIQNMMTVKFNEAGLSMEKATGVINAIVDMYATNPQVALAAINTYFKFVLPPQVQKMVTQNLNVNTDLAEFNKASYSIDVPLTLEES
jgi:hypothetical protein